MRVSVYVFLSMCVFTDTTVKPESRDEERQMHRQQERTWPHIVDMDIHKRGSE